MAKGFGKTLFSLQLIDDYLIQLIPRQDTRNYTHLKIKARAEQLIEASAVSGELIKNGLKTDGTWQTLTIPYKADSFRNTGVYVRTGDDNGGYLEVAEATLVSESDPTLPPLVLISKNTYAEDFITSRKWAHREPGIGRVEKTGEGIKVSVVGSNKAYDAFSIESVRQEWYDLNLKVLALGAICSDAQVPAFKELNAFASQLAAMRHISEKKLIYDTPNGVYGTFWTRDERIWRCNIQQHFYGTGSFRSSGSRCLPRSWQRPGKWFCTASNSRSSGESRQGGGLPLDSRKRCTPSGRSFCPRDIVAGFQLAGLKNIPHPVLADIAICYCLRASRLNWVKGIHFCCVQYYDFVDRTDSIQSKTSGLRC